MGRTQRKGVDRVSGKRGTLLNEVKSLLADLTDEDCKITLAAIKMYRANHELSPEECVELARKEVAAQ